MAGDGKHYLVVVAAGIGTVVWLGSENAAVAVEVVGLDERWNMLVVAVIDQILSVVLESGDVQFCDLVVVERVEMVEVLLVDVEQHGVVWGSLDELQLVSGQFGHYDGFLSHLFDDVEEGDADVAGEDGVFPGGFEYMVDERRRRALAFGAGNANDLFVVGFEEEVCLRGDAFGVNPVVHVVETDARGFEDEVVFVEVLVVAGAFHEFQFFVLELVGFEVGVSVCHGERHVWEIFANEAVGGDALFAEAEDDDLFAFDGVYDVIS